MTMTNKESRHCLKLQEDPNCSTQAYLAHQSCAIKKPLQFALLFVKMRRSRQFIWFCSPRTLRRRGPRTGPAFVFLFIPRTRLPLYRFKLIKECQFARFIVGVCKLPVYLRFQVDAPRGKFVVSRWLGLPKRGPRVWHEPAGRRSSRVVATERVGAVARHQELFAALFSWKAG